MSTTYDRRLTGINTAVAIKAPCVTRTISNITLSGTQTIDGVAVVADDRVLVVAQTTTSANGIYKVSATAWERADDFDGSGDIVKGTMITVLGGSTLGFSIFWKVTTANPITIGTTGLTIAAVDFGTISSFGTMANQNANNVTITGGAIDGVTIGGSTAAAITGTTIIGNSFKPTSSTPPTLGMYTRVSNFTTFYANSGPQFEVGNSGASATNFIRAIGAGTGSTPQLASFGTSDTNIGFNLFTLGTGGFGFWTNASVQQFGITHTASSANYLNATGGAAGAPATVTLSATGSSTDVDIAITPKGAGVLKYGSFSVDSGGFAKDTGGSRVSTQFDKTTDTTLANVTGLTATLLASGTYVFRARLTTTAGAAGGMKCAISGTVTPTSIAYSGWNYNGTTVNAVSKTTTLGNAVGAATAVTTDFIIEGTIVVTTGGTITVQMAQNASDGTASSVLVNSSFKVERIA